jgi:2-C-methyl-D-erythritol 4-phosphate cytidylyltransferase
MPKIAVIVVAAGKSERFEGKTKKPFANLDGRPIFIRSLEKFINRDDVCQTILVVSPDDAEMVKQKYASNLAFMGVTLAEGGTERFNSVAAALQKVSDDAELIAVHDAVRPCVSEEMIDAVLAEGAKSGAAILAAPLSGTIKRVGKAKVVDQTVDRTGLYEAQTPQVFRKDVLLKAYEGLKGAEGPITDDAALVERTGHPVAVVESDMSNLKITAKGDLPLATAIIKSRPGKKVKKLGAFEEAQW